jgi:hypothetical protein
MGELFTPMHILVIPFLAIFFLPIIVAGRRRAKNYYWIALLNIVGGGSGVGWVAALYWAFHDKTAGAAVVESLAGAKAL